MAKRAGLGRGLGAFFGDDYENRQPAGTSKNETETEAVNQNSEKKSLKDLDMVLPAARKPQKAKDAAGKNTDVKKSGLKKAKPEIQLVEVEKEKFVKLSEIEPNSTQPRKMFDEEQLQELAESMKNYGVLQPLLVQKKGDFCRGAPLESRKAGRAHGGSGSGTGVFQTADHGDCPD